MKKKITTEIEIDEEQFKEKVELSIKDFLENYAEHYAIKNMKQKIRNETESEIKNSIQKIKKEIESTVIKELGERLNSKKIREIISNEFEKGQTKELLDGFIKKAYKDNINKSTMEN